MALFEGEPALSKIHEELHHYTDWNGVTGILKSNTLWATHFRHLNDHTEVYHLGNFLKNSMIPHAVDIIRKYMKSISPIKRAKMGKFGSINKIAEHECRVFIEAFYKVFFDDGAALGPVTQAYVASFCSHTEANYEKFNGLLSQWRGYGGSEAYCIVVDSLRLERLLEEYYKKNANFGGSISDVIYDNENAKNDPRLKFLIENICDAYKNALLTEKMPDDISSLFLSYAPRFKHRGFMEEREVRIVYFPMSKIRRDELRIMTDGKIDERRPIVDIFKASSGAPTISLFSGCAEPLPVKRIIVGPHRRLQENAQKLESFLRGNNLRRINIHCSETPFR